MQCIVALNRCDKRNLFRSHGSGMATQIEAELNRLGRYGVDTSRLRHARPARHIRPCRNTKWQRMRTLLREQVTASRPGRSHMINHSHRIGLAQDNALLGEQTFWGIPRRVDQRVREVSDFRYPFSNKGALRIAHLGVSYRIRNLPDGV